MDLGGELDVEKRFFQKLAATARDLDLCVLVCHHMRKGQGPDSEKKVPGKQDFIGSSHLVNASAACSILWQDKAKAACEITETRSTTTTRTLFWRSQRTDSGHTRAASGYINTKPRG